MIRYKPEHKPSPIATQFLQLIVVSYFQLRQIKTKRILKVKATTPVARPTPYQYLGSQTLPLQSNFLIGVNNMYAIKTLATIAALGGSLTLSTVPAFANNTATTNSLTKPKVETVQSASALSTFRTELLSSNKVAIILNEARFTSTPNGIEIQDKAGTTIENLSTEIPADTVQIITDTIAIVTSKDSGIKLPTVSLFNWKCALGTWGAEGAAGVTAIIGILSAPVTLGTGTAAGITAAAALSGAASGTAANCF